MLVPFYPENKEIDVEKFFILILENADTNRLKLEKGWTKNKIIVAVLP